MRCNNRRRVRDLNRADSRQLDASRRVERQQSNHRPNYRRRADDDCGLPSKILVSWVAPWMENGRNLTRHRIDRRQIRSLEEVTPIAREAQVVLIICSPVLAGANVLDVEGDARNALGQVTILATVAGPGANETSQRSGDQGFCRASDDSANPFRIANTSSASMNCRYSSRSQSLSRPSFACARR